MAFTFGSSAPANNPPFGLFQNVNASAQSSSKSVEKPLAAFSFSTPSGKWSVGLQFQWRMDNVTPGSFVHSKMIEFENEKMFRLALKTQNVQQLFLISTNHGKRGLKISSVSVSTENPSENNFVFMSKKVARANSSFQMFLHNSPSIMTGSRTFTFRVHLTAANDSYCYQQVDNLMKSQLWSAVENKQLTDMTFVVQGQTFAAHKAVVSGRSPVFAAMFSSQMKETKTNQVEISDIDPTVFEHFLHFLYTGQLKGSFGDPRLLAAADKYQVETLKILCESATVEMTADELTTVVLSTQPDLHQPVISHRSLSQGEVSSLSQMTVMEFTWAGFQPPNDGLVNSSVFEFRNEKLFRAALEKVPKHNNYSLVFVSTHHKRMGFKILDVTFSVNGGEHRSMKSRVQGVEHPVLMYTATQLQMPSVSIIFQVYAIETIDHYAPQLADVGLSSQLWSVAQNKELTDVEIVTFEFVGKKVFSAHKAILAARSPVFAAMFEEAVEPDNQLVIKDIEASVFAHFLSFLYTGRLKTSANNKQLLLAAEKYQITTLQNLCQAAVDETDVDDLTAAILFLQ